ncbi:hypothetical protein MYCTH_95412 [Thermothelomyces thermophilus ATCC 42464]|uniref:Uncharacterized protein n=1 Tax=Thermothelomyces thermophilus (strain ATCC 42464 / BCRC 31852 / DSM 1799) TaxID=573729 RepID=G2QFV1_THET4|nr:uncharacterized protein MYCTH_95412 [Thermothelomyces thermophilus ATCC 42464]AEO58469.1 hypothetical protein MYCTH_95412 [Thermothelomyces thermophilus ATCC 42464]
MDGTTALLRADQLPARVWREAGRSWVHERNLPDRGWRESVDEQVKLVRVKRRRRPQVETRRGRLLCFTSEVGFSQGAFELLYGREANLSARALPHPQTMAAPVQVPCRVTAGCPRLNSLWTGIRDNLKENMEEAGARQQTGKLTNVEHNLYATPS